jgi:UDP-N-acetylmuramyl tripeptide synthase
MSLPDGRCEEVVTPLQGLYSAYNVLAATAATLALGLPWHEARRGLASHGPFGRQEEIAVRGRRVRVVLAKNPAGLNQVLRTLADASPLYLAIFLNDRLADGRDVSWIWDVDFELLQGRVAYLLAGGDRAYDLALRLKYASLQPQDVERRPKPALERALAATPQGGILHVVPTYTALLEVREILARWAGRPHFWEG